MTNFMREASKALYAAGTAAGVAVTAGILTGQLSIFVTGGIATALAFTVTYLSPPNQPQS